MGDGPSSNIGNLINDVFGTNSKAVDAIGSAVGAVADVSGAVGAAVAIADLFISQPDPLQPILDTLQKDFAQLYAALEARQNEEDWRNLAKLVSDAEAVLRTLDGLVHAQPPLTDAQRLDHIATGLAPLIALSDGSTHFPSPFFLAVYSEQVYWTDAGVFLQANIQPIPPDYKIWQKVDTIDVGYGTQAPPAPPDNQVFSCLYVLPYYLKAVFILTAVGTSFFADFGKTAQRQQDSINLFAKFLATIHDLIAGDITKLTPPPPSPDSGWQFIFPSFGVHGITAQYGGMPNPPQVNGLLFEWGAVEKFSGYSSIKSATFEWPTLSPSLEYSIFQKLQVRAVREMIKVYAGVGLPSVWTVINGLNKIAGQAPLPPHKYSAWSFREIFGQAGLVARSDGVFHLSDMANLIRQTPPYYDSFQTGPVSWRNLLEPAWIGGLEARGAAMLPCVARSEGRLGRLRRGAPMAGARAPGAGLR